MTRTIEIPLPEELLRQLDEKARNSGLDRDAYVRNILSKDVANGPSIDEILRGFREQVAESGISDVDLDHLFIEARSETRDRNPSNRR